MQKPPYSTTGILSLSLLLCFISVFGFAFTQASAAEKTGGQCTAFFWAGNPHNRDDKAFLILTGFLDGKKIALQLDTASPESFLRFQQGDVAAPKFPPQMSEHQLQIGGMIWDHAKFLTQGRQAAIQQSVYGTAGLNLLAGLVTTLDYRNQRICFYRDQKNKRIFGKVQWQPTQMRGGWLLIKADLGGERPSLVAFDTGASLFELVVPEETWKRLTGKTSRLEATLHLSGKAWGQPITLYGAPSVVSVTIGGQRRDRREVWIAPHALSDYPARPDGIVGNAAFLDSTVVLDLRRNARFGVLEK
ncbi:hypothetical protein [Acetobacter orleanensis]|uniref:hypothetical protein n=1 Tax=Acetobacter orleanensis TaxID=104099 RepID=UPI0011DDAC71|nr:hypothetical protein [Acetobacter orleanensis]